MKIKTILTLSILSTLLFVSCAYNDLGQPSNSIKFTTSIKEIEKQGIYINWVYRFYYLLPATGGNYIDVEERTYIVTDGTYMTGKNKTSIESYKDATFLMILLVRSPSANGFKSGIYNSTNPNTDNIGFFNLFALGTPNQFIPESPTILPMEFKDGSIEINFAGTVTYYENAQPKNLDATLTVKGQVSDLRNL